MTAGRGLIGSISITVCVTLFACVGPLEESDPAVGEQLMRGFADVWTSKDLAQIEVLYAEDAVFEDVPDGVEYRGHEEIKASLADDFSAVPDVKVEVVSMFVAGNRGALEWIWSGTQTQDYPGLLPATGKAFSVRGVSLFEFENGKIKRHLDYYDAAGFLHQLGVEWKFPEG